MSQEQTKVCTKCGKEKLLGEFCKNRNFCKVCDAAYKKAWQERKFEEQKAKGQKVCSLCKQTKNISEFTKHGSYCKSCVKAENKKYKEENKERLKIEREKYLSDPVNHEKFKAYMCVYNAENRDHLIQLKRKYYSENRIDIIAKSKEYQEVHRERYREHYEKYAKSFARYQTYSERLMILEEFVEEGPSGEVIVLCAYCGKIYRPTTTQAKSRVRILDKVTGSEHRFYCSSECKQSCPIYNQRKYSKTEKDLLKKNGILGTSREVPAEFRKMALADRDWTCEKCGSQEDGLHVHHIEGYTEAPMFAADLQNVLVVCKSCHIEIHKQPGCTYRDYARCKPEVSIPTEDKKDEPNA